VPAFLQASPGRLFLQASPGRQEAVVAGLRAAHAMEQASLKQLAAMRWRAEDQELVHDIVLHHKETNRHAERIRERLDELGAWRARPLDWAGKAWAYLRSQPPRLLHDAEPHDVRAAHAFELREIETYEGLERKAAEAGDERTAELCREICADEVAMASGLSVRLSGHAGSPR
jgi:ferritin-like metal-binding protein YciE